VTTARQAIALAVAQGKSDFAREMEVRLKRYEAQAAKQP
jgi:hypothetical protein